MPNPHEAAKEKAYKKGYQDAKNAREKNSRYRIGSMWDKYYNLGFERAKDDSKVYFDTVFGIN